MTRRELQIFKAVLGVTDVDIAKALGKSPAQISQVCTGDRINETLRKEIADFFAGLMTPDFLFSDVRPSANKAAA